MSRAIQRVPPLPDALADTLPIDVLELPRWVLWKLVQRGEGKATKVPYNAHTGRKASVTNGETWATFGEALHAYHATPGRYAGLGFVLGDGLCGVDLDACREASTGVLAPWALAIVRELAGYAEVSPSGTGVHIWLRGVLPTGGRRRGPVEMYDSERFLTVTGDALADALALDALDRGDTGHPSSGSARAGDTSRTLPDRTDALAALHARIFPPTPTPDASPDGKTPATRRRGASPAPMQLADSELILKAHNAKNGGDFARLWSGDASGYTSASEADMALIRRLSFWVGPDAARIDALYHQSGLYPARARKWNSKRGASTWGAQQIETVLSSPGDFYTPHTIRETANASSAATRATASGSARASNASPMKRNAASNAAPGGAPPDALADGVYTSIPGTPWYLAPDGGPLLKRERGEGGDFLPAYEWDAPTIHARVKFPPDGSVTGRAVMYDIELDGQRELIAYGALHKGEAWERWGSLGVAGRSAFANMAATVEYLARRAPVTIGARATGWTIRADTGRHALLLPNGAYIGCEGVIPDARAYMDVAAHHVAPYDALNAAPPSASVDAQGAALHFITANAARSLATLALLAHVRSIMYGVWRSDFTVILRGGSGRGKTTVGKMGRNLTGVYGPDAPATAAFTGPTAASIEKHLSQMKSLPVVLDDLVLRDDMTPGERADVGKKVEMVVRALANNEPIRQRQTSKMEDAPAYKLDACPILTAEELPPEVKASALNRSIVLDIADGDVQVRRFYSDEANAHRAALQAFGLDFITWLAGEWDTHGAALVADWMDTHRAYTRQVERDMLAARGGRALLAETDRLPSNAAHILLAAHVLNTYAQWARVACPITPDTIYSDVLAHLAAQVETIETLTAGSATGERIGERIGEAIREALARCEAFITNADGTDATQHRTKKPEQLGYRAALSGDYQRATRWLGELTPDGEYLTLDRLALHDLLKHTARVQHWRAWHVSARELAAMLHRAGLLKAPASGRHLDHPARRGGRVVRRLVIPCEQIWPDYSEGGDAPDGGEGIETGASSPTPDGGAADALADTGARSPDGWSDEDGRELLPWGDEDADADALPAGTYEIDNTGHAHRIEREGDRQ